MADVWRLSLLRDKRHYISFRTMSRDVGCPRTQSEIIDCSADGFSQSLDIVLLTLQTVEEAK